MTSVLVFLMFLFLVFQFPYTTGYSFNRSSMASQMATLYRWSQGEWMFGYAVPPLILALLVYKYDEIRKVKTSPSSWAYTTILFAFLFYWIGYKTNNRYFGFFAIQILVMGVIHLYLGWKMFWQLKWLWLLLGMTWPLIFLIDPISFPLQMIVTKMTSGFLNLIGVDTVQNGTSLISAASETAEQGELFSLKVAGPCSGIRSLFSLTLIGLAFSYITLKTDLKRCLLLLSVIPLVLLGNFIRLNILLIVLQKVILFYNVYAL